MFYTETELVQHIEQAEAWKPAHDEAMACIDTEDAISNCLKLLEDLYEYDADIRLNLHKSQDPRWSTLLNRVNELFSKVHKEMQPLGMQAACHAHDGHEVKGLSQFLDEYKELTLALMSPDEFFARLDQDALSAMAVQALEEDKAGLTLPMDDLLE